MIRTIVILLLGSFFPSFYTFAGLVWESTHETVPAEVGQSEVVGVFAFRNTGRGSVEITGTESSCGCTVAEMKQTVYRPGESGELRVVFTVGDRTGPQRKVIRVNTGENDAQPTRLILETEIPVVADLRPRMLMWRKGEDSEWKEAVLETDPGNRVALSEEWEPSDFPFEIRLEPEVDEKEDRPTGRHRIFVKARVQDTRMQRVLPLVVALPDESTHVFKIYLLVR